MYINTVKKYQFITVLMYSTYVVFWTVVYIYLN